MISVPPGKWYIQSRLPKTSTPCRQERCMQSYTAVVKHIDGWWIGWIEEISGVNCQELTKEKLIESLKSALTEAIEMNRQDALLSAEDEYIEVKIAV